MKIKNNNQNLIFLIAFGIFLTVSLFFILNISSASACTNPPDPSVQTLLVSYEQDPSDPKCFFAWYVHYDIYCINGVTMYGLSSFSMGERVCQRPDGAPGDHGDNDVCGDCRLLRDWNDWTDAGCVNQGLCAVRGTYDTVLISEWTNTNCPCPNDSPPPPSYTPPPYNPPPGEGDLVGSLDYTYDDANGCGATGWALNKSAPDTSISVFLYKDGPKGSGTFLGEFQANSEDTDLNNTLLSWGWIHDVSVGHRWWTLHQYFGWPLSDGITHAIYAYANDSKELDNSPKDITCAAPPPSYSCTPDSDPQNATLCSGDNSGLSSNTAKTAVKNCGAPKCEYKCISDDAVVIKYGCFVPQGGDCGTATTKIYCQAPTKDLCSHGEATNIVSNGNKWVWICKGQNNGENKFCTALKSCAFREVVPN